MGPIISVIISLIIKPSENGAINIILTSGDIWVVGCSILFKKLLYFWNTLVVIILVKVWQRGECLLVMSEGKWKTNTGSSQPPYDMASRLILWFCRWWLMVMTLINIMLVHNDDVDEHGDGSWWWCLMPSMNRLMVDCYDVTGEKVFTADRSQMLAQLIWWWFLVMDMMMVDDVDDVDEYDDGRLLWCYRGNYNKGY